MVGECAAARGEASFQVVDGVERLVHEGLVAKRPEVLCRLDLGRVWWLELEDDPRRDPELGAGVPAGAIEREQDHLPGPDVLLLGEGGEHLAEDLDANPRNQVPRDAAAGRVDEAHQVKPLVAMPDYRVRPLAPR